MFDSERLILIMKALKKAAALLAACALCIPLFTGCGNSIDPSTIEYIQLEQPKEGEDIAIVETSMGDITVLLYTEEVPEVVQNFKDLVNQGFYDNQIVFHVERAAGAVATGSSTPDGNGGDSNTGKPKKAQYSSNLWPFSGSVAALCYEAGAFWNKSNYYDSRFFFIGDVDVSDDVVSEMEQYNFPAMMKNTFIQYGGVPQFGQYHTVFGKIISGMDVVDAILALPLTYEPADAAASDSSATQEQLSNNRPVEDVVIRKITLSTYDPADFDHLDNTPTAEELEELEDRSAQEQAEMDAALTGQTTSQAGN